MREQRFNRAICFMVGCVGGDPVCHRCDTDLYDPDFIQYGKLQPLFRLYWRIRQAIRGLAPRHCDVCGKKYRRGYSTHTCSEACFENWLPF